MKEKPIAFSEPMVKAIIEGRKSMTRRTIKIQPKSDEYRIMTVLDNTGTPSLAGKHFWGKMVNGELVDQSPYFSAPCQVGDVLWVREAWRIRGWNFDLNRMTIGYRDGEELIMQQYNPKGNHSWMIKQIQKLKKGGYIKADRCVFLFTDKPQPFKQARFMPRLASRILLRVTDLKVERLHEISDNDILAEGLRVVTNQDGTIATGAFFDGLRMAPVKLKYLWVELWTSINGYESWAANPWVWVISFEVLSTNGKLEKA